MDERLGPRTLLHVFTGFGIGGAQVRFTAVANHFGRRYRHLIVSMNPDQTARERLADGLDIGFPAVPVRQGETFGNLRPFRRALRALAPDVLVTHNWGSMDWAIANLVARVRHIHIEDGFGPDERDRQIRRRVLTRRLILRQSMVVLPSRTLERIATDIWRLPRRRLRYIPNGIDLSRFAARPDPSVAARFPGEGPVIGTVTGLRPEKALDRLLRAFASLAQPTRLVIVGDGPERGKLMQLAAGLGVAERVSFTGHVTQPAMLYAGFDIFALSSDTEQMPLSVIEAMAAGLPVAATEVGDVRLMLASENAAFIGPKEDQALARSLDALLADPARRALIGAANRAKAARDYDETAMFAAYGALFDGAGAGQDTGPWRQARKE